MVMRIKSWILVAAGLSMAANYGGDPVSTAASNAAASGKISVVEFISNRADHARILDANLYRDPRVKRALLDNFIAHSPELPGLTTISLMKNANSWRPLSRNPLRGVVRVAVEDYPEVHEAWHITSLPTFFVVDRNGSVIARYEGMPSASAFAAFLARSTPPKPVPAVVPPPSATPPGSYSAPVDRPLAAENLVTIPWSPISQPPPSGPPPGPVESAAAVEPSISAASAEEPHPASSMQPVEPTLARAASPSEAPARSARPITEAAAEHTAGAFRRGGQSEFAYRRTFAVPTLWSLELSGDPEEVDIDLEVLDGNGRSIELSEGPQGRERIELALAPGEYTARVFAFREIANPVEFDLEESRRALPADRMVPGADQGSLTEDETMDVELGENRSTWLRFSAGQPGRFRFTLDQGAVRGGSVEARAIAADGRILGRERDDIVDFDVATPGRVYLELARSTGYPTGLVRVGVKRNTEIDLSRVRREIAPGDRIDGLIGGGAGIESLYRVRIPEAGSWRFNLKGAEEGVDIDVEILKSSGELVERAESPGPEETLRVALAPGEERYARVYVYRAAGEVAFTLTLERAGAEEIDEDVTHEGDAEVEAPVIPPDDAERLTNAQPVSGSVARNGSVWFRVDPARDGLVVVLLDGGDVEEDIDLSVHKADGERMAISQADEAREAILVPVRRGEPVFVRVYAYGQSAGGRFRVWFQTAP
jgi:hypothetical protein